FAAHVRRVDRLGRHHVRHDQPLDERLAHVTGAHEADGAALDRHRPSGPVCGRGGRGPKIAVPTRTSVAPSSIATSKSPLIPIESCDNSGAFSCRSRSSRSAAKSGRTASAASGGGIIINPMMRNEESRRVESRGRGWGGAHRRGADSLAHGDERDVARITSCTAARLSDAVTDRAVVLGHHNPCARNQVATSGSGSPMTLVYEPTTRSTRCAPSPWIAYAPALPRGSPVATYAVMAVASSGRNETSVATTVASAIAPLGESNVTAVRTMWVR